MATLPKTGRTAPRQISTEQLPQTPAPRSGFVPSVQPGVAQGITQGLSEFSAAAVNSLDERERQFFELEQKVQRQKVTQTILKGELDFQQQASEKLNALETDGALTKDDFHSVYGQFLDQQIENQVNESGLTGVAAELYKTNLEAKKNEVAVQAGLRHQQVMNKQALDTFGGQLNQFTRNRPENETFSEYVTQLNRYVSTKGLDKLTSASQTEIVLGVATGNEFIRRFSDRLTTDGGNSLVEAEQFLERHRFDVPPEFVEKAESMFVAAEKEQTKVRNTTQANLQKMAMVTGKDIDDLTPAERFYAVFEKFPPDPKERSLDERVQEFEIALGRKATEDEIKRLTGIMEKEQEQSPIVVPQGSKVIQGDKVIAENKKAEQPTGAELGKLEAEQKIAYMNALKEAGISDESMKSDLVDEQGNLTVKADSELRKQMAIQLGGSVDENGQVIGLSQEKATLISGLMAEASQMIRDAEAKSISEAVNRVRLNQPPGTFKEDLTFPEAAERFKQEVFGGKEPPPEATPQNAEQAMEEFNAEVSAAKEIDLGDATGVVSGVIDSWNTLMGQFSPEFENEKVTEARMNLALLGRDFIRLMALNSRFAVAEQELLRSIFPGPSAFNTPEKARNRIKMLGGILDKRISEYETTLGLPFKQEVKGEAFETLKVLYEMQATIKRFDLSPGGKTTVDISAQTKPEDISGMSEPQVRKFVQNADDATLNSLSPEQQRVIKEKLGLPNEPTTEQPQEEQKQPTQEPAGAQKFITPKITKMIQSMTTEQLNNNLKEVQAREPKTERDLEMITAFEEILALRKGRNETNRKGKKRKKQQAEPKEENPFIGKWEGDDTEMIRKSIAFLTKKGELSPIEKQTLEAMRLEMMVRGEDAN